MNLSNKVYINCPICAAKENSELYTIDSWKIVGCQRCKFVYVNPRLETKELLNLYNSNYFNNTEFGYKHYTEDKELRKKNFRKWINDALPYLRSIENNAALDIGCATGYCLEIFKEKNWTPYGIDLDTQIANDLTQKGYHVYNTPLVETDFKNTFSIITLFDVAEHLTDLHENFKKLHSILDKDGIVVMITPNYNSFQRKIFGKKWFQFKPIEHINYFTLDTIAQLVEPLGFKIILHKNAGQFCDYSFLENRLQNYRFKLFIPILKAFSKIFNLKEKAIYTDTASLYLILKKSS